MRPIVLPPKRPPQPISAAEAQKYQRTLADLARIEGKILVFNKRLREFSGRIRRQPT